ncbi:hypothetical protein LINPERPRIM_LOCUS20226 [Linum perenne]
MQVLIKRFIM